MQGLGVSDQAEESSQTAIVHDESQEAHTDDVRNTVKADSVDPPEKRFATVFNDIDKSPLSVALALKVKPGEILASIEKAYKSQGLASFFQDQWLVMELRPHPLAPGLKYLASHAFTPSRTVSHDEVMREAPWSNTAKIEHLFALAPISQCGAAFGNDVLIPSSGGVSAVCIRITAGEGEQWPGGNSGLSAWAEFCMRETCDKEEDLEKGVPRKTDVLDAAVLPLRPTHSRGSYMFTSVIHRFDHMPHGSSGLKRLSNSNSKPFSAWYGSSMSHAKLRALNSIERPDENVKLSACLYSIYTPATTPHSGTTTDLKPEASVDTNDTGNTECTIDPGTDNPSDT